MKMLAHQQDSDVWHS